MSTATLPVKAAESQVNGDALYEVVKGQRVELPAMSIFAAFVASLLQEALGPFVRERKLGRVVTEGLFILDPQINIRRRPDVAFVSAERWGLDRPLPTAGDWPVVPDLAIEVVSPNDEFEKVLEKISEYFTYRVKQVWLIVPSKRIIYVHDSLTDSRSLSFDQEVTSPLLPGFRLKLADLAPVG